MGRTDSESVERRGFRWRSAPAVPAGRNIPAVPAGSGAPAVPDGMEGGTTGGGRGERGRRGTPAVRAGIGDEQGKGEGKEEWSGGEVWIRVPVEGHPFRDFGDRRVGGGGAVGFKVRVLGEGGVPTGGEGRAVAKVAGVGLEEGLWARAGDEAGPKVGVQESSAHEVGTFKGGGRARGSGVGDRREKSGVFEGKEGIGKMRKGLANARETDGGKEYIKATVVVRGRGEIEAPSAMLGPILAGEGFRRRR